MDNTLSTNTLKNIVVVGQGAMGLLWYHHLSHKYNNITLLASNHDSLNRHDVKSAKYQFTAYRKKDVISYSLSYCQLIDIKAADIIIFCLKSFNMAKAIKEIAQDIAPHTAIILANNGMGAFEKIMHLLPRQQPILALLTTHGCLRNKALSITHTGLGQSDIGLLSGVLNKGQQAQLTDMLNRALPQVSYHQNIVNMQWLKLAINCVINPITAINNISNGEVSSPRFTEQVLSLLTEITQIAYAENITLISHDLQVTVNKVALATAENCSSMRSDIQAGRATEIDFINGYIHHLGQKHNIATPENTRLWQQVSRLSS